MSKYIKREHILAEIDCAEGLPCGSPIAAYEIAKAIIEDAPTIDAVEVVRCKDCKYFRFNECEMWGEPAEGNNPTSEDGNDYCSWGERKTDHE